MIATAILTLSLAVIGEIGVEHFSAAEMARSAGIDLSGGPLIVGDGERVTMTLASPAPFEHAGLWWVGSFRSATARVVDSADRTGDAQPVVEDHDQAPEVTGTDRPAGARSVSGLINQEGMIGASLILEIDGPATLDEVSLVWIAPTDELLRPLLDNVPQVGGTYPKPAVYSRAQWGAVAPQCSSGYCNTTHIAVHHSASSSHFNSTSWSQCASNVKGVQNYHMFTNGWCDIGYNYLVCVHGDIFEGRAGGDNVKGAHDGYNCGSMGVCLLGYFHTPYNQTPSNNMLLGLEKLAAWKCSQQGINPLGSSYYAGYGATMTNIYGHRNVSSTACPGDKAYALLPQIRNAVKSLLDGTGGGGNNGTIKGVLYNANVGTSARIAGGTVSLANGSFVISASDGYYEFPLPAGTYPIAGTAGGYVPKSSTETVSNGDVWESIGLTPNAGLPVQTVTKTGTNTFYATYKADPGTPAYLVYNSSPGIPLASAGAYGLVWPKLSGLASLYLGIVPANGTLAVNLQTPNTPGLILHTQGFCVKNGQAKLTNGAGLKVQ